MQTFAQSDLSNMTSFGYTRSGSAPARSSMRPMMLYPDIEHGGCTSLEFHLLNRRESVDNSQVGGSIPGLMASSFMQ